MQLDEKSCVASADLRLLDDNALNLPQRLVVGDGALKLNAHGHKLGRQGQHRRQSLHLLRVVERRPDTDVDAPSTWPSSWASARLQPA